MNRLQFTSAAIAVLGTANGWQTAIAEKLGVADRTVRRWIAGEKEIPAWVDERMKGLIQFGANVHVARDEWIIGEDVAEGRRYILHTRFPRFLARIVYINAAGEVDLEDYPVATGGTVFRAAVYDDGSKEEFREIIFYDSCETDDIAYWLDKAADLFEEWLENESKKSN